MKKQNFKVGDLVYHKKNGNFGVILEFITERVCTIFILKDKRTLTIHTDWWENA